MKSGTARNALIVGGFASLLASGTALADIVNTVPVNGALSQAITWFYSAGTPTPATLTGDGLNNATGPVVVGDLSSNPSSTYTFGNNFTAPNGFASGGTINGQTYGFVDTYVIMVPASLSNAVVFSLNLSSQLGLSNLTARLFDYSANGFQNLTIGGVGAPVAGSVIDLWSLTSTSGAIVSTALPTTTLAAGEYVLQVAGIGTAGALSGTYSGQLNVAPVPLPAALPLLLGGLALLGRRRRTALV